MSIEIRPVTEAEFPTWSDALEIGLYTPAQRGSAEFYLPGYLAELDRTLGAFDGDRVVGTLRGMAFELTVPGGAIIPAGALNAVTVLPTHRRRGILTGMMTPELRLSKERGEAVHMLIAAEYLIYGRYGYGPATETATYAIDTTVPIDGDLPGTVDLVDAKTYRQDAALIYERCRPLRPGAVTRRDRYWDRAVELIHRDGPKPDRDLLHVVCHDAGEAVGYATYKIVDDDAWASGRPKVQARVIDLGGVTPQIEARLWQYLCSQDWVSELIAADRPTAEPLRWFLSDARAARLTERTDFLWVRVLDVCAALGARTYEAGGRLVLRVEDKLGLASGTYLLEGGPSGASCVPTDQAPDLVLSVESLSALYLGAHAASSLGGPWRIVEERAGALRVADRMFATAVAPHCGTWF